MVVHELGKEYTRVISDNKDMALKFDNFLLRDMTIIGTDVDVSMIEEISIADVNEKIEVKKEKKKKEE